MTRNLLRAGALSCALLTSTALCTSPMMAQQASVYQHVDRNGIDLVDGSFNFSLVEGGIGAGKAALSLVRTFGAGGEQDNLSVRFSRSDSGGQASIGITIGNRREDFIGASAATSFTSVQAEGATLTKVSASEYVYRDAAGTVTTFAAPPGLTNAGNNGYCATGSEASCSLIATSTVAPDGSLLSYQWDVGENCFQSGIDRNGEPIFECAQFWRQRGITNSYGYAVQFSFATEANPTSGLPGTDWHRRTGATFYNTAVSGSPTRGVSYATPSSGVTEITTDGGYVWRLIRDSQQRLSGIRRPGSSADDVSIGYAGSTSLVVNSVTRDGITTGYSRSVSGNIGTMTVTDANGKVTTVGSNLGIGRPTSVTDPLSRTTEFAYDNNGRLTRTTFPEDNYVELTLDARGNVTQTQAVAKPGSGAATLTTSASYPSSCSNPVTCNQPTSITDARGNTTDYSYDSTHGGLTSVMGPAPHAQSPRPEVRHGYSLTDGEYQLTSVSACASGNAGSCVGTSAESRMVLAYDTNGNVTSREARDGTGALSAVSAMTYTSAGDIATIDGPLSGAADTMHIRYNQARQPVGAISPDPDGSGSLVNRAVRIAYDSSSGLATKVEQGTVTGTGDNAWAAFSAAHAQEMAYDSHQRPVVQRLTSGGTTFALTQTSYDNLGRANCVAQRMNPAEYDSLPSDACTLDTEGSFGPDRIGRTSFDDAGQVVRQESAVGTAAAADEVVVTYTGNGRAQTLTDGEGNQTTYVYDGHDRLSQTQYPSPTTDGVSNSGDFEQLSYDAAGNVISRRLRDGNAIAFTYDALSRPTGKDLPGSEPDVSYGYDLLGRLTSAATAAQTFTFTHDALGRQLTETGPLGPTTSVYDIAGRRTSLSYPDGFVTYYTYLVTGEMATIAGPGNFPPTPGPMLITFGYDSLGRRTSLARTNGAGTSYNYDAVSRLASLAHDLSGTNRDVTFGYSYNPASQIVQRTSSNDAYSPALANANVSDTHNGLNQLTGIGSSSVSHDSRGNTSSDPLAGLTYSFSSENLLTGSSYGTLTYDPLTRLYDSGNTARTRVIYDGVQRIGEYNQAGSQRGRVVFGSGIDEPLIEYSGSSLTRQFLHADERGSIVGASNDSGTSVAVAAYDDYGRPLSFASRFGYTGQPYETVSDLQYSRARFYNPRLGRFMQTDPIEYGDGMNLYGYVSGDPVNFTDPLGLKDEPPMPPEGTGPEIPVCGGGEFVRGRCVTGSTLWRLSLIYGVDRVYQGPGFHWCDTPLGGNCASTGYAPPPPLPLPTSRRQARCQNDPRTVLGSIRLIAGSTATAGDVATVGGAATLNPGVAVAGRMVSGAASLVETLAAAAEGDWAAAGAAGAAIFVGGVARAGTSSAYDVLEITGRRAAVGREVAGIGGYRSTAQGVCQGANR